MYEKHREDVYKLLDINGYKKNVNYFSYRFLDKDIIDPEECLFGGKEIIVKEKKSGKKVVAFLEHVIWEFIKILLNK